MSAWPRFVGLAVATFCVWMIAYPLWPNAPVTVPLGLWVGACWIGYCLGAASEGK